jgi:hypothetical protein
LHPLVGRQQHRLHAAPRWLRLIAPKVFEPLLAQFRISRGVLNGAMAEPILNGPDIVTLVCQSVAAGVPQHVHMDLERKAGPLAYPFD